MEKNIEIENQIKKYFSKFKQIQRPCVEKYLNENKLIKIYLNQILNKIPEWLSIPNIIQGIIKNFDLETCKICGKKIKYHRSILFGKSQTYCSIKCSMNDPEIYKKIFTKSKETCIKKYGVDHPCKSVEIKEKIKNTLIKNYGVDNPLKSDIIKEKVKNTNIQKYGGNAPASSSIVLNKMKDTNVKKYGVDNPAKCNSIQKKIKRTCIEKYGVDNYFKSDEVKEYNSKLQLKKGYKNILNWSNYVIPLFTLDEYKGVENHIYRWKCVKYGNEFEQKIYTTHFHESFACLPRCLNCYPFGKNDSKLELELLNFCKKYFPDASKNKSLIKPLELDIVIHKIKLAIEFNGVYYHSLNNDKGVIPGYHLNKVIKCNEKGYRLIHIWEDEWNSNKDLIKQKLIDIFEGNEIIDYNQKLDRSWYNNLKGNFEELPPEIIIRDSFEVENCGYLIYKAQQETTAQAEGSTPPPTGEGTDSNTVDAEIVE